MPRSPLIVAATVVLASLGWALVLAFGSGPLVVSAAALLAIDLLILGTAIAVGFVLARGRWTRWAAYVLLGGGALVGIFFQVDGWWIAAVALTAVAIGSLAGPWPGRWLRRSPSSDGPPPLAVILTLGLVALPGLVAVTAPSGVPVGGWLLSGFTLVAAWMYSQAWLSALWATRVALPLLGIAAIAPLSWVGVLVLGLSVAMLTALAWSPDARQATMAPVAAPAHVVPIPPELAPPEILEAAGFDDRGRRTKPGEK